MFYLYDEKRLALLPALLASGVDLEARNQDGETALMQRLRRTVQNEQDWERLKPLIQAGANVNAHTSEGRDVLQCWMLGSANRCLSILDELLALGASPHAQVPQDTGPLARAVMAGLPVAVVERLLKAGASLGEADKFGRTALSWSRSRPEVAQFFADYTSRVLAGELAAALPAALPAAAAPLRKSRM